MAVELVEKAAESLVGRFERSEGAARADVQEARALEWYLCNANYQHAALPMERCLYTFLLMLRLGSGEDIDVPAPKPLRDFSRRFFNMDSLSEPVFSGVDEEEDVWEPLEDLWRDFNKGKVCPRSSELRWRMNMGRPRQPARRPPPLLFESYDDEEDSRRPCGWGCGGECLQPRTGRCQRICRGFWRPPAFMRLNEPRKLNPECSCTMGSSSGCWNIFDLVDRLVYEDQFVTLPVHNLGWNLRKALQRQGMQADVIDEAYLKASKLPLPDYRVLEKPSIHPVRVREARRLIQGLKCSPFLRKLLLSGNPQSMLPLHVSLADAVAHARLWLLRSDLPVHLEDRSLTYAVICTASEPKDASDMLIKERVPSILELQLRSNTLNLFWQPRATKGLTGWRVGNMRPEDHKVPEPLFRANERLWEALIGLPHPIAVCAEGAEYALHHAHPVRDVAREYARLLLVAERRETRRFLFPGGEPKVDDFHDFNNAVIQATQDDLKVGLCYSLQQWQVAVPARPVLMYVVEPRRDDPKPEVNSSFYYQEETLVHWPHLPESPALGLIHGSPVSFPSSHYLSITGGQIQAPVPPVLSPVPVPVPVPVYSAPQAAQLMRLPSSLQAPARDDPNQPGFTTPSPNFDCKPGRTIFFGDVPTVLYSGVTQGSNCLDSL